jgi:hypothetical protein
MEARLTDHVWTLREVLLYRVQPRPQPQALYKDGEGKDHETGVGKVCPRGGEAGSTTLS